MQLPVNSNATTEAKKLLAYLCEVAGNGIISGQHTQTIPMEEIEYIKEKTNREPKLRGFELLAYSPNINFDDANEACLTEVYENENTLEQALKFAKETDGIITFTFHWFSPLGGRDKSFYTENTDFDPANVLLEGTPERDAFYSDMREIAQKLQVFKDEKIPILWRPFHESEGTWFWWASKGPEIAGELYKLMYHEFVDVYHLDNLLWVWNCPLTEGYPGDEYVDVVSLDVYLPEYKPTDYMEEYEKLISATSDKKVAALAEIGYLPDADMMAKSKVPFAYFMVWSKEFCIGDEKNTCDNLKKTYDNSYVIKLGD